MHGSSFQPWAWVCAWGGDYRDGCVLSAETRAVPGLACEAIGHHGLIHHSVLIYNGTQFNGMG